MLNSVLGYDYFCQSPAFLRFLPLRCQLCGLEFFSCLYIFFAVSVYNFSFATKLRFSSQLASKGSPAAARSYSSKSTSKLSASLHIFASIDDLSSYSCYNATNSSLSEVPSNISFIANSSFLSVYCLAI